MNEENLINYYNKFNENNRLKSRHGDVEFYVTTNYINKYLNKNSKIIDIGAGCGAYSNYFESLGYDVTACELVKHNYKEICKNKNIKAYNLDATDLKGIKDNYYDIVLLFGPIYHLHGENNKLKALKEAKRVCKNDGYIFICYCLPYFAIMKHAFLDNNLKECLDFNVDNNFEIDDNTKELYSFDSIDNINSYRDKMLFKEVEMFSQEGLTEYFRKDINKMDNFTFNKYKDFILKNSSDKYLLGSSRHIVDIVKKA